MSVDGEMEEENMLRGPEVTCYKEDDDDNGR